MNIVSIGGGPAGLYFALLIKKHRPTWRIRVIEREREGETFGFGVVFSDATLGNLASADPLSYERIAQSFARWDRIDFHVLGQTLHSSGHGFCGIERRELLRILIERGREVGVEYEFHHQVFSIEEFAGADLIVVADGVNSATRSAYARAFMPEIDLRPNRFVWLGTTAPFTAFTFIFKENPCGLWRVHAYRYKEDASTFIVETTERTWCRAGLENASEDETIAYLGELFAEELGNHPLIKNRSIWQQFPTVRNKRWVHENLVLVGDAAHTAHFSIGSGTKLAMEDAIVLCEEVLEESSVASALTHYESSRRSAVARLQQAAQVSLEWFEHTERYKKMPAQQFVFSCLTRSLRVSHDSLAERDPAFVGSVDEWFSRAHGCQETVAPALVPFVCRSLRLPGRRVAVDTIMQNNPRANTAHLVLLAVGTKFSSTKEQARYKAWFDETRGQAKVGVQITLRPDMSDQDWSSAVDFAVWGQSKDSCQWLEIDCLDFFSPQNQLNSQALLSRVKKIRNQFRVGPLSLRFALSPTVHRDGQSHFVDLVSVLCKSGVDLITVAPIRPLADKPMVFAELGDWLHNELSVAVCLAGGVFSEDDVSSLVLAGRADLCVISSSPPALTLT